MSDKLRYVDFVGLTLAVNIRLMVECLTRLDMWLAKGGPLHYSQPQSKPRNYFNASLVAPPPFNCFNTTLISLKQSLPLRLKRAFSA